MTEGEKAGIVLFDPAILATTLIRLIGPLPSEDWPIGKLGRWLLEWPEAGVSISWPEGMSGLQAWQKWLAEERKQCSL